MISLVAIPVLAGLTAMVLTPVVAGAAVRRGLIDRPDVRKQHSGCVPLGGGIAVVGAALTAILVVLPFSPRTVAELGVAPFGDVALAVAVIGTLLVGLLDDARGLRVRQKLPAQAGVVLLVIASGTLVHSVAFLGYSLELGVLAVPTTALLLLTVVNAFNLIDGADGLASTLGTIALVAVAFIASHTSRFGDAAIGLAVAGSLLGFLAFNRPRATIFLGDAGSLSLGLVVGVMALRATLSPDGSLALAPFVGLLVIPLLDLVAAVVRRRLTGQSITAGDRRHLHHVLQRRGVQGWRLLAFVAVITGVTAGTSFVGVIRGSDVIPALGLTGMLTLLVFGGYFGTEEVQLCIGRIRTFMGSLFVIPDDDTGVRPVPVYTSAAWTPVWGALVEFSESNGVLELHLDIRDPDSRERLVASWGEPHQRSDPSIWSFRVPVLRDGHVVGHVFLAAVSPIDRCTERLCEVLGEMVEVMRTAAGEPIEATRRDDGEAEWPHAPHAASAGRRRDRVEASRMGERR